MVRLSGFEGTEGVLPGDRYALNFAGLHASVQQMNRVHFFGKRCTGAAFALLVVSVGCSSGTGPDPTVWQATLSPESGSVVRGTAGAVTQSGRTAATIQIRKATAGETYGWRVDSGRCSGTGQIQGGAALYPPLIPDGSGTASADAGLPGVFDPGSAYAARVFRVGSGGEEVVACGDLQHG
jgi:hypothetical protein